MSNQLQETKFFCNALAIEKGIDPVGNAGNFEDSVIIEHPLPWKYSYTEMGLSQKILDLLDLWMARYKETGVYGHQSLLIAPDSNYSKAGFRRVMFYIRPDDLFAEFEKTEYLVPEDKVGALVWAWYEAKEELPQYEAYRQQDKTTRDILICTHGSVDVACAKFGYPLYKQLRENSASDNLRVWRVSHFGGHLYAPTVMDMPKGDYWAYVDNQIGEQIIERTGNIQDVHNHYRGWAGLSRGFVQAMERACLMHEGWQWQSYLKKGEILTIDPAENSQWAEVRIDYVTPQGLSGAYQARVKIEKVIITNPASNDSREYSYPQFVVEDLKQLEQA